MAAFRLIRIIVHSVQMVKSVDALSSVGGSAKCASLTPVLGIKKDLLMLIFFRFNIN